MNTTQVNIVILILAIILTIINVSTIYLNIKRYPNPKKLPRSNGLIHHPTFGSYPQTVPYKHGMSLLPGQMATTTIELRVKTEKVK